MGAESFADWLARIVREDDLTNGGAGILALGNCETCEDAGYVPASGADYQAGRDVRGYAPCPDCSTRWAMVRCDASETGSDAVIGVFGIFASEAEALGALAIVRDDDPETGDGWTVAPLFADPKGGES